MDVLTVGLFFLDPFDVDDKLFPVDLDDFTGLFGFQVATDDFDFVVFDERHRPNVVFGPEFFGKAGAHELSPLVGSGLEVVLPLSPWGG